MLWGQCFWNGQLTDVEMYASSSLWYCFLMLLALMLSSLSLPWLCSHLGIPDRTHPDTLGSRGPTSYNCHILVASHRTVDKSASDNGRVCVFSENTQAHTCESRQQIERRSNCREAR